MRNTHITGVLVLSVLLALGAIACRMDSPDRQVSDAQITSELKTRMAADQRLGTLTDINVDTHNGVVTLSGVVESEQERRQAEQIARNTDGVRDVNNNLQVQAANGAGAAAPRDNGAQTKPRDNRY